MFNENTLINDLEEHGFTSMGYLDLSEPDYSFDILEVWKNKNGYWYATDSGCSCNSPWDEAFVTELSGPYTKEEIKNIVLEIWAEPPGSAYDPEGCKAFLSMFE